MKSKKKPEKVKIEDIQQTAVVRIPRYLAMRAKKEAREKPGYRNVVVARILFEWIDPVMAAKHERLPFSR